MTDRTRPEDEATFITVSDPVQHSEGMNKYTSYRVDVRVDLNNSNESGGIFAAGGYSAVLRRYSDFFWLYDRLHKERAGAILPPLPEKQAVARFSEVFVEDRRINLERFIRRVVVHPELGDAQCLQTFLKADDSTFHAAKNSKGEDALASVYSVAGAPSTSTSLASSASQAPPVRKAGIKQWFADTKTSIATSVMGTADLVRSPDDDLFQEIEKYISALDTQMKNVVQQASGLVRKGKEISNGLFEFGLAFNLLSQSENDELCLALSKVGDAADALSVLTAEQAEKEMFKFEEPLQDYIKTIHAVKLALQKRHERRVTYTSCLNDVQTKSNNLAKLRGVFGKEDKAYQAEMSLHRSQLACDLARDDFANVSQRLLREVDRFKREKADDMRMTVMEYINLQIHYNKRMEEVWTKLIPQLEDMQVNDEINNVIAAAGETTTSS